MNIEPIAFFRSPLTSKFGVPRQSGIVCELRGRIEFVPRYKNAEALRRNILPCARHCWVATNG